MIDFKNKDELPTTVVTLGSIVVFIAALGFVKFGPKPTPPTAAQTAIKERKIAADTAALNDALAAAKSSLQPSTWDGTPDSIAPAALKQVNSMLIARHLKLVGFHSQKSIEQPNVTLIPYIVSVDGSFVNVIQFTRDMEKDGTKFVVNLLQIANADQTTDKVTASIGITAYQLPQAAPVDSSKQSTTPLAVKKNA